MEKLFVCLVAFLLTLTPAQSQLLKKLGDKVKDKVAERADQKTDQAIDKGLDKTEDEIKNTGKKNNGNNKEQPAKKTGAQNETGIKSDTQPASPALKVYNNYDFVPGDKILFEDHFTDDQNGEFASHWELKAGQAVLNKLNGDLAMHLIDGNYAVVTPRMKTPKYLADAFTIDYDFYHLPGAYGVVLQLKEFDKALGFERESTLYVNENSAKFEGAASSVVLAKDFPNDLSENFDNKWHHVAVAVKNHQLKVYVDQYRVLVVPDTKEDYFSLNFAGIGDEKNPVIFKNARIAAGAGMNMLGKKFTDSKIITHGINFDYNKATITPESMGTLNMIVQVMKDNPDVKFEVGGHTDGDGSDTYNLTLSQQRADAVISQLVKMGIDPSRLTAKGYGKTKPISDNTTPEGKANNRRVEFVKK